MGGMPSPPGAGPSDASGASSTSATGPDYRIAVLHNALDVLELLAEAPQPLGATDISRQLGATKSATYRILVNLESRGYVVKDSRTARYSVGARLLGYGLRAGSKEAIVQAAHPWLERLSEQLGETANLGMLDGTKVQYITIVESPHDLRMAARAGARDDLHSTAMGKALLAFLPDDERDRVLSRPLRQKTPRTVTDVDRLREDLSVIRTTGIAAEYGENEMAAACFGIPLFGPGGNVIAAISVAGPEGRMKAAGVDRIRELLLEAAQSITREVGGTWPRIDSEGEEK